MHRFKEWLTVTGFLLFVSVVGIVFFAHLIIKNIMTKIKGGLFMAFCGVYLATWVTKIIIKERLNFR